jgi:hypothetical protein
MDLDLKGAVSLLLDIIGAFPDMFVVDLWIKHPIAYYQSLLSLQWFSQNIYLILFCLLVGVIRIIWVSYFFKGNILLDSKLLHYLSSVAVLIPLFRILPICFFAFMNDKLNENIEQKTRVQHDADYYINERIEQTNRRERN